MEKRLTSVKRLFPALILAVLFSSCTKDPLTQGGGKVQEGLSTQVNLSFSTAENRVETRAAQDASYESRVNNLYVFIFNAAGEVHSRNFFTTLSYDGSYDKGSITINTTSLNDAQVICIANLSTTGVQSSYNVTEAEMNAITSLDALQQYVMELQEQTVERSTQFMMTGYAYDNNAPDNTHITIPGSETGTSELACTLKPERTDAKIEFIVKTEIPEDKKGLWSNFDFRPESWRVVNVPAQSMLLAKTTGDADGDQCEYFATDPMPFETVSRDDNYLYTSGGFVFYMPENRKTPTKTIPADAATDAASLYALREEHDHVNEGGSFTDKPGQKFENGAFTYAPANSTYVEMSGTLSYQDSKNYTVNANVTFTVHLGYANGDPNDYETKRNTHYTYTVTLRGVDNIVTEVTSDLVEDEPRAGYDGDVIYSQEGLHELDAHYDRELITIDRSKVSDMKWGIQTPFGKAIYNGDFSSNQTPENNGIYDYKWIKFAVNDDYGVDASHYVKYPGDQNYKGTDGGKESPYYSALGNTQARMLDVHQLLQRLKEEYAAGQTSGTVAITAFIDEYVYVKHPESGADYLDQWRTYVEAEDRLLYFINGESSKYSPDGASSVIEAIQTFKQKSIRTVYNTKKSESELPTIWGLESRMEGTRWAPGDVSQGSSRSNGRLNTIKCILSDNKSIKWTDVLNTSDHYDLNASYQDAVHAVLLRNRDLNGDNIVQDNEIRWYLAAIDQLVDLYIGEYALDDAARLYPQNAADRENQTRWHYTSSSYDGSNPWVLWAEECVALGSYTSSNGYMGGKYAYRCIRNLGLNLDDPDTEPTALIPQVTQAESDGTYIIDVTNLSEKSRRLSFEAGSLPQHDDESPYNRPYGKFRVSPNSADYPTPEIYGGVIGGEWRNDQKWAWFQNATLPNDYRMPNLRELLIMGTRLPDEAWKEYRTPLGWYPQKVMYMTYTSFSRQGMAGGLENKVGGFRFNAKDKSIGAIEAGHTGYARGVKDLQYQ